MQFELYRISLLPTERAPLFTPDEIPTQLKNRLVAAAIKKHTEGTYRNRRYRFTNIETHGTVMAGRLSCPDEVDLSMQDERTGDLIDTSVPAFAWTHFVYLARVQVIAIQRKHDFFAGGPLGSAQMLEAILINGIDDERFKPYVAPVSSPADFWKTVSEASFIGSVSFDFATPNVFGGEQELRRFLELQQHRHNATRVKQSIENRDQGLQMSRKDRQLRSEVEYTSRGGGEWTISYRDKKGKQRRKSSSELIATVSMRTPKGTPASLVKILNGLVALIRKAIP